MDLVGAAEADVRKRPRGPQGRLKLASAVSRVTASLLRAWMIRGQPVRMALGRNGFVGRAVSQDQFLPVMAALQQCGLVATVRGIQVPPTVWEEGVVSWTPGLTTRYWPRKAFLDLAEGHGLTKETIATDFVWNLPTQLRAPPVVDPVRMTTFRDQKTNAKRDIRIDPHDPIGQQYLAQVEKVNNWAAEFELTGCLPPRWSRIFTAAWPLGGRWTSVGAEGNYQLMAADSRVQQITINAEPVAEVDISASHLSIMHGLLQQPLPEGDLYDLAGIPRAVVKQWVVMTLGKGTPPRQWTPRAIGQVPELQAYPVTMVGAAVCERYPFMKAPAATVAGPAGLADLGHLGKPQALLIHRLMAIEADALTAAMNALMLIPGSPHILALPMHDGLIVPNSHADLTARYVSQAFDARAGVAVRTKTITACALAKG